MVSGLVDFAVLRAVFFDLDDTWWDHRSTADQAALAWARRHGIDAAAEAVIRRWQDLEARYFGQYARGEITFAEQRRARVRAMLGIKLSDEQAGAEFEAYLAGYQAGWRPYPDARPALERCRRAGLATGLITNGDEGLQRAKITAMGLDVADVIVISGAVGVAKPDRAIYDLACQLAGVTAAQAVMIGDSPDNDVAPARAAGLQAVLVDRRRANPGAVADVDWVGR
jgi:putative hydrolase of the HAD superfamily